MKQFDYAARETEGFMGGAAKRNITPPEELWQSLFSVMPMTRFQKKEGELYVRALVLGKGESRAVLVHYELDQAPFPLKSIQKLSSKYMIPEENFFFLGNHSHEIPVTGIRVAEPEHNAQREKPEHREATQRYEALCLVAMEEAVAEAMEKLEPVRLGLARGESFINVHREMDFPSIYPVDRELNVLCLQRSDGSALALLLNYSTHNNAVKSFDTMTADLEGCVTSILEERFPGAVCMWTLAAHGDLMCRQDYWNVPVSMPAPAFADPARTEEPYVRRMRVLALRQSEDALKALEHPRWLDPGHCEIRGSVRYAEAVAYPVRRCDDGSVLTLGGLYRIEKEAIEAMNPRARKMLERATEEEPRPWRLRLHLLRIGDLVLLGNGGKLYNAYKTEIRALFPVEMYALMLSQDSCEDSTVTYIPDDRALWESARKGGAVSVRPGAISMAIKKAVKEMMEETGIALPVEEESEA